MNWLKYLVGLSAVIVAGCAAYFSVTGLGVLFAGASTAVMVMAGSLEFAKLVAATYLKQKWEDIGGFNKWYLTSAVGILMLITSAGIFGYLSNAFQQQNLGLQKIDRDIAVYQTQITKNDGEILRYTTQLTNQQNIRNSQESNLSKQIDKNTSTSRVSQMIKSADKEITSISKRIDELTIKNNAALDSINVIKNNNIELEKEVGGFRFVAEAFNVPLNSVVKFFIFIIVFVFDPLAVALIIAFNGLIGKKNMYGEKEPLVEKNYQIYKDSGKNSTKEDILGDMVEKNQQAGLYEPPFENPLIDEPDEDLLNLKPDYTVRPIDYDRDGSIDGYDTDGDGLINEVTAHPNRAQIIRDYKPYYALAGFDWSDKTKWINDQNAVNYWIRYIKPSQYPTDFETKTY
jgi:cell division protein FtsL